ncbi:hypothetical protein JKP88DRAFT_289258 [Tribonema minus]|uniref:Uncharacterized protein n=1 Tax=Tribonema minus TaxID=303371 RepID=A0A835Z2X0_9STRA|nr:hypothetical protein JKP88DRAFT_289258 [Tribonema minus]
MAPLATRCVTQPSGMQRQRTSIKQPFNSLSIQPRRMQKMQQQHLPLAAAGQAAEACVRALMGGGRGAGVRAASADAASAAEKSMAAAAAAAAVLTAVQTSEKQRLLKKAGELPQRRCAER